MKTYFSFILFSGSLTCIYVVLNRDFTRNYLDGAIPIGWTTLPLINLSLMGNRLSGEIPRWIGNLTNTKNLDLEANQFPGHLPQNLGKRIFQNWTNLYRLEMQASGFEGPSPSGIVSVA
ncbi:unnamed protein product [Musa acuminata var. zebrina]